MALLLAVIAGLCLGTYWWWQHEANYPSTDDAFLQSNIVSIAPRVAGTILEVSISESQHVEEGDLLFRIDDQILKQTLDAANAQLIIANQNAASSDDAVATAQASANQTAAALADAEAELS